MNVCIAGGSGFIGSHLKSFLLSEGHRIALTSRNDFLETGILLKLSDQEVVINLAGESIFGRWSAKRKKSIYNSRILTTRAIVKAINEGNTSVKTVINISAVGIYNNVNAHDEDSIDFANNFLADMVFAWERELKEISNRSVRVVILRMGVVLGKYGGLFKQINTLLKFHLGINMMIFRPFPFIHINDVIRIINVCMLNENLNGVVNVVAPLRTNIRTFFKLVFQRSNILFKIPVNEWILNRLMGESAIIILASQVVIPQKLIKNGFSFEFPDIESVIDNIFDKSIKNIESI